MEIEVNAFLRKLETDPAYSESTQLAYANDLRVFLLFVKSHNSRPARITDLNNEQITKFLESERQQGRSRNTLVRRLATLKYFQDYLVQERILEAEYFSASDNEILSIISKIPERDSSACLNREQIQSLLLIMSSSPRPRALRDQAIFMILLETGLSVGQLTDLDMTDLDLNAKRFHVSLDSAGDVWLGLGEAHEVIEEYVREGRLNLLHKPGEPALFISQMDGRLSRQGIWQILKFWGQQVNPTVELSPRIVRHTAVLRMKKAGLPIREIQMRLGHRNHLSTQALIRRLEANCDKEE
ncbi:MAG: tyrosine-type recombinase/integrase [Anaerolineales bacterium]|jgi:integrase/recombinase XerD